MFSEVVQDTYKRFNIDFNTDFRLLEESGGCRAADASIGIGGLSLCA